MRSDFEQFERTASARRGTGEAAGQVRLRRRLGVSIAAVLGLMLVALGGYRATLPTQAADPLRTSISTGELTHDAGEVPISDSFDPH